MNKHLTDPLTIISVLLAITGAVQGAGGLLTPLMTKYPMQFGIGMTIVSTLTGVLTYLKNSQIFVEDKKNEG